MKATNKAAMFELSEQDMDMICMSLNLLPNDAGSPPPRDLAEKLRTISDLWDRWQLSAINSDKKTGAA